MPGTAPGANSKQIARNEEKLRESGIVGLEPGTPAPSFTAVGTAGSSLTVGSPAADPLRTASPVADEAMAAAEPLGSSVAADSADEAAAEAGTADTSKETANEPATDPASASEGSVAAETETSDTAPEAVGVQTESLGAIPSGGSVTQQPLVLIFFPAINTPNSAKQLIAFGKEAANLEKKGLHVYGINPAPLAQLEDFAARYEISVPLLSDADGSISVAYGCMAEGGRFPQRTAVGIGADGKISFFRRGQTTPQNVLHELKLDAKPATGKDTAAEKDAPTDK